MTVPSTDDPEDARRRKLLNILLLGIAALTILVLIGVGAASAFGPDSNTLEEDFLLYSAVIGTLVGVGIIFAINRYGSGWVASLSFLLLLTAAFTFSDSPREVANGRTLFLFAIPVVMSSVLLRPYASFVLAGVSSLIISVLALAELQISPNVPAILGFFALALVSWLSARSLENALEDLRAINRELDQRVADRTADLAKALNRVQEESNKNQAILESIADGVIVFDDAGTAIVANPAIPSLIKQPSHQIINHDINTLMQGGKVRPEDQEIISNQLADARHHGPSVKIQWGDKILSVSFASVRDASSTTVGTVAVFRDFTREAELDRMKSAFVSMASHELRTPLNAILGYTDMLQEGVYDPLTDGQRDVMGRIMANSRRMLSLVNNLLDQAQMEAGRLSLHMIPFSPVELIEDLKSVMSVLSDNKGLDLVCSIDEDIPETLHGDPQRLEQILINLTGNAIKFTEQGWVKVHLYRSDLDYWAIEVSDTGAGIPQEAHSYIFESFRQVDDSVTRKHQGSGLGLSIVKQLTTLMGGEISLESEVGKGSTFKIVLPFAPLQEEGHE
ncbi:MAG: PAS domain-containing protein [Anaerolineae bacterium]|nr:PAS domain-containing protein [Anaerolineae bacterium]